MAANVNGEDSATAGARDLTTVVVHQWQCDHFGHLNVRNYAAIFDDAIFVFWSGHLASGARTVPVSAETRVSYLSEALPGTVATVRGGVRRIGTKSVALEFEMVEVRSRRPLARCEVAEVFFDLDARQSRAIPADVRESLDARRGDASE